jgi:hypothetical protein
VRRLLPNVLLLTAAACGGGGERARTEGPRATAATTVSSTVAPTPGAVPAVLNWEAKAVAGGQVTGANYTGRAVALWFWAPW